MRGIHLLYLMAGAFLASAFLHPWEDIKLGVPEAKAVGGGETMYKLIVVIISMVICSLAIAAPKLESGEKPKYENFIFTPKFGEPSFGSESFGGNILSSNADNWLKTQIGSMKPEDFNVFGIKR